MALVLNEEELQEDYDFLHSDFVFTEKLLESVVYSMNKHAKNARDCSQEEYGNLQDAVSSLEYRYKCSIDEYMIKNDCYDVWDIDDDQFFSDVNEAMSKKEDADNLKYSMYEMKDILLEMFLRPIATHADQRSKYSYGRYQTYWLFYSFYKTENASFHTPIEDIDDENFPVPLAENLYVSGRNSDELLSVEYCKEIYNFIINNKEKIIYSSYRGTNNYPGDDQVFIPHLSKIDTLLEDEFHHAMSSFGELIFYDIPVSEHDIPSIEIKRINDNGKIDKSSYVTVQDVINSHDSEKFVITERSYHKISDPINNMEEFYNSIVCKNYGDELSKEDKFERIVDNGEPFYDIQGKEYYEYDFMYEVSCRAFDTTENKGLINKIKNIVGWQKSWDDYRGYDFLNDVFNHYKDITIDGSDYYYDENIYPFNYYAYDDYYNKGLLMDSINVISCYGKDCVKHPKIKEIYMLLYEVPREKLLVEKDYESKN